MRWKAHLCWLWDVWVSSPANTAVHQHCPQQEGLSSTRAGAARQHKAQLCQSHTPSMSPLLNTELSAPQIHLPSKQPAQLPLRLHTAVAHTRPFWQAAPQLLLWTVLIVVPSAPFAIHHSLCWHRAAAAVLHLQTTLGSANLHLTTPFPSNSLKPNPSPDGVTCRKNTAGDQHPFLIIAFRNSVQRNSTGVSKPQIFMVYSIVFLHKNVLHFFTHFLKSNFLT